jgi:hypothetical protein
MAVLQLMENYDQLVNSAVWTGGMLLHIEVAIIGPEGTYRCLQDGLPYNAGNNA